MDPVARTKLRDVVARRLKAHIVDENLRPGDRLPTETELAVRFGVSRLSLREATKSLEFLGILESRPGRGLTVGRINMDRISEFLGFHPALQDVPHEDLIESRIIVETGVFARLSQRMQADPAIHASLSVLNQRLTLATDLAEFIAGDVAFHSGLIAASGLTPMLAFQEVLAIFFQRFRKSVKSGEWHTGIACHQRILDLLRDGRVEEARAELIVHVGSHRDRINAE